MGDRQLPPDDHVFTGLMRFSAIREALASVRLDGETRSIEEPVTVGEPPARWTPEDPGYRDTRDHPEAWFSPSEGYIVRALRTRPDEPPPLVRTRNYRVVHKLPKDAVRLTVPAGTWPGAATGSGKWHTIARDLVELMGSDQIPSGAKLPSEAELVAQYDVSRGTVRKALAYLEAWGLIETRHGLGRIRR